MKFKIKCPFRLIEVNQYKDVMEIMIYSTKNPKKELGHAILTEEGAEELAYAILYAKSKAYKTEIYNKNGAK